MQLRSRGFRVETVDPGQIPSSPADLEVCLEECAPEDVLTKAAVVKESEDLWVFVAPGALDERSRPMRVIPLVPQVSELRAQELIAATMAEIRPMVEVPAVEWKRPILEPEDDPILCELAARQVEVAEAAKIVPRIEPLPVAVVGAMPVLELKPVEQSLAPPRVVAAQVAVKAPAAPMVASSALERVKKIAVRKPLVADIPIVPERAEPKLILQRPAPAKPKRRFVGKSYKISFRSGPKLWRTASVTLALLVLAGLLATVVAVRPPLPASPNGSTGANPPIFLPAAQATAARPPAVPASAPASDGPKRVSAGKNQARPPASQAQRAAVHPAASQPNHAAASRRRATSDDGIIAEDTVIFYNRRPAPPTQAKLPPASGVKRYADTN